ncbi:MAG: putative Ig domain-containing protein [Pseudomonadota bacterium]
MHKTTKSIAYMAIALLLTACGGGGGGGGGTTVAVPPPSNNAPVISGSPADTTNAGRLYTFTPTASDADGDTLTFSIQNQPPWATFDDATGQLSGTPFAASVGTTEDVLISVSDGEATASLAPFSLMVTPQQLTTANFVPMGATTPMANGYRSVGTLTVNTGEREQVFENSDLTLEFDEEGNLLDIFGDTDLPPALADNVAVNVGVRAFLRLMSGAEISADPTFGIDLPDEIDYFVYFLGAGVELTVTNPIDPNIVNVENLEVPLIEGEIHIIADPTDTMLYRYGELNGTGAGRGESFNRLIRFEPVQSFPGLDAFGGDSVERGQITFGLKGGVELVEIQGYRVMREPSFSDIDWDDVLNSEIQHRTGTNGIADFGVNVLNVGVFDFADASLSALFVSEPLRRESIWSFSVDIGANQEDVWVPDWFHVLPRGGFSADANFDNIGSFFFDVSGNFESTIPAANLSGSIQLSNDGAVFEGSTAGDGEPLVLSLSFLNFETVGRVEYPTSFESTLRSDVSDALDRELVRIDDAVADLEEATADYEFEVSLRGLRESLPVMMNTAIATAQSIPGLIEERARTAALNRMRNTCTTVVFATVCVDDVVDENAIADDVASSARAQAAANIVPHVAAMQNLRARALEDDDEALREALRAALAEAYNQRTYSRRIRITRRITAGPFNTTLTMYDQTYTRNILSSGDAAAVAEARDNAPQIQVTSDQRIAAQDVVDALPIRENVEQTKEDVNNGTQTLPIPSGFGYTASGLDYSAFVTVDGQDFATELNVLSPGEALEAGADAVAELLLDE